MVHILHRSLTSKSLVVLPIRWCRLGIVQFLNVLELQSIFFGVLLILDQYVCQVVSLIHRRVRLVYANIEINDVTLIPKYCAALSFYSILIR